MRTVSTNASSTSSIDDDDDEADGGVNISFVTAFEFVRTMLRPTRWTHTRIWCWLWLVNSNSFETLYMVVVGGQQYIITVVRRRMSDGWRHEHCAQCCAYAQTCWLVAQARTRRRNNVEMERVGEWVWRLQAHSKHHATNAAHNRNTLSGQILHMKHINTHRRSFAWQLKLMVTEWWRFLNKLHAHSHKHTHTHLVQVFGACLRRKNNCIYYCMLTSMGTKQDQVVNNFKF